MLKLLNDPLLHFIFAAIFIFFIYRWVQPEENFNRVLNISETRMSQIESRFEKVWHRAPTVHELANLKRQYALDQIYAIEARAIGMDRSDAVVVKRLRQKMEFMLYGIDTVPEPSDDALQQYFSEHKEQYPNKVYYHLLNYSQPKSASAVDKERFIGSISSLNRLYGEPERMSMATVDLRNALGARFVTSLNDVPLGQWVGPIESNESIHFVKIEERIETDIAIDEVKPKVISAWKDEKAKVLQLQHQQILLNEYGVVL